MKRSFQSLISLPIVMLSFIAPLLKRTQNITLYQKIHPELGKDAFRIVVIGDHVGCGMLRNVSLKSNIFQT